MKILAIDCSGKPVSAAVLCDDKIISYTFSDINLTHSQTLFPIIESTLEAAKLKLSDIEALGVSTGPGSFTGLRIGIASIKGIAEPNNLKCVGVSTLQAAAYMFRGENAIVCPAIDARCSQVYNALFEVNGDTVTRLCDDRAIMIDELIKELKEYKDKKIVLCCDAAKTLFDMIKSDNIRLAPPLLMFQNAVGVGLYADKAIKNGDYTDAQGLLPAYLKLPQAERELKQKKGDNI